MENRLAYTGSTNPAGGLPVDFFTGTLAAPDAVYNMQPRPGYAAGGASLWTMQDRLFNALGSTLNDQVFVLVDSSLNCLKTKASHATKQNGVITK